MADPISDALAGLASGNPLCILGAIAFVAMFLLLLIVLRIKKLRRESKWAYNPDKTLKLRWRRG